MSQRSAHFRAVWQFLEEEGMMPPERVREIIQAQQSITTDARVYKTKVGKLMVPGTMASGDGVTITFNSLILIMTILSFYATLQPLHRFPEYVSTLGFTATVMFHHTRSILRTDFLQSRFWLEATGGRVFGPKPGRILARFFWIPRRYTKHSKYRLEAANMSLGLLSQASHIPIINDICRRVLELERPNVATLEAHPQELASWRVGDSPEEHPHTLSEMSDLYHIPYESLQALRKRCREWSFGEPIDNTAELSATVAAIAATDLE